MVPEIDRPGPCSLNGSLLSRQVLCLEAPYATEDVLK